MYQKITAEIAFSSSFPYLAIVLGVAILAGILGLRWWKQKTHYKSLEELPCPPRHWLLGNIPQLSAALKAKRLSRLLFDWAQELGSMYVYWIDHPVLILSNPKVIEETLINGVKDGSLIRNEQANKAWNDSLGPIMLGQNGSEWQWRRNAWNPEFIPSSLSEYLDLTNQACEQAIDKIKETKPPKEVRVDPLFVELTMRVICSLVLGIPIDSKTPNSQELPLDIAKVDEAISIMGYRFLRLFAGEKLWMKYLPTKNSSDYWAARRYLENWISPHVDLALQMREQTQNDLGQISPLFQKSMLAKIAAKQPKYNREFLIAETLILLLAGTDTTAHALSFTVGELALNPRVFQKAQTIVDLVWQNQGGINVKSIKELEYIGAIFKEALRLYSVSSGSSSLLVQRDTIIDGKTIPRGTEIFWSTLAAGRDPEVYPQPNEFLPERWLDTKKSSSPSLLVFGSGSHRCLGEHLSMLEATVMLSLLLQL